MSHMWKVFRYELMRNLRRKGFLFTTFGIPLIGLIFTLGYQVINRNADAEPQNPLAELDMEGIRRAGYVDETGMFTDPGELGEIFTLYSDESAARAALDAEEIDVYYVVPADYLATGDVRLAIPRLNLSQINTEGISRLLLNELAQSVDDDTLSARLIDPSNIREVNLQRELPTGVEQDEDASFFAVYIFAIALMFGLFTTNGYLMQSLIEEKETRLIEILISSIRPIALLAGKILAMGVLGLIQILVWVAGILVITRVGGSGFAGQVIELFVNFYVPPDIIPVMLVYFVLAYLMFAGLYSLVSAVSNSMREGPQYAIVFTLPAALPLYFIQAFVSAPNSELPTILSLFPLTSPISMILRLLVTSVPAWQIALSLALLALAVVGAIWLAARMFRVQTLLAGQPPKLRDIPRLLRG